MKTVKRILLILAILLILVSAVGLLFFPGHVEIARSIEIKRSPEMVFRYVNDLKNYNSWSPWYDLDPTAKYTIEGTGSGVCSVMKWESKVKEVGSGSLTYTEVVENKSIKHDLNFMENGVAKGAYAFEVAPEGTKFTWSFSFEAGANPLLRIMGAFVDDMVGKDFDKGLAKLKKNLEEMPEVSQLTVERMTIPDQHYMFIRDKADEKTISEVLGRGYGRIMELIGKQGLKMAGAPFAIYHTPPPVFDMEIAIPVEKLGKADGEVKPGILKAGNVLMVRFFGAYEKTPEAHAAIDAYAIANNVNITGAPWESYITDPATEKDTSKWETDVYYPVQ